MGEVWPAQDREQAVLGPVIDVTDEPHHDVFWPEVAVTDHGRMEKVHGVYQLRADVFDECATRLINLEELAEVRTEEFQHLNLVLAIRSVNLEVL